MKKICYITTVSITIKAFFIETLKGLVENGYEVTVICDEDENLYSELPEGVKYIPVKMERGINLRKSLEASIDLYKIFMHEKYDLIQYSTPNASLYASLAAKFAKIDKKIYHNMGFVFLSFSGAKKLIFKIIEKMTCLLSDKVQFVSNENLGYAINNKIVNKKKAYIVWNGSTGGVNLERFNINKRIEFSKQIREEYHFQDDDFVFGFVGRITADKGINELLMAFRELQNYNNVKLMIVGEVENLAGIDKENWKWALDEENIVFCGKHKDIEKYYAAMDVLVLPSYREGFGNVLIEAAAMGTTAIASNIPGPRDIIKDGQTGILCRSRDFKDLADKFIYVLNDKEAVELLGRNARFSVSKRFDSKKLVEKILQDKKEFLNESYN